MRKIEELRSAAKELVETLGLVDENKDDIVITNKMKAPELEAIIKDAVNEPGLITPDDEFTEETLEIIEEYKEKPKPTGKKKPAPVKEEEEEDPEEEEAPPAKKSNVKTEGDAKPKFKHEGSFAAFTDEVILAGGAWDEILPKLEKEIKKRGLKMSANQGLVNNHIKYRIKRDPNWLGNLKLTENGIE